MAARARRGIQFVGKSEITAFVENFPIRRTGDFTQHQYRFIAQHGLWAHRHDITMPSHLGRLTFANMQIGGAFRYNCPKKLVEISHDQMTNDECRSTKE